MSYRTMGLPKLGASAMRTFRGIAVRYTFGPKYSFASSATCFDRLSRPSYMVSSTPSICSASLRFFCTMRTVLSSCDNPSRA